MTNYRALQKAVKLLDAATKSLARRRPSHMSHTVAAETTAAVYGAYMSAVKALKAFEIAEQRKAQKESV